MYKKSTQLVLKEALHYKDYCVILSLVNRMKTRESHLDVCPFMLGFVISYRLQPSLYMCTISALHVVGGGTQQGCHLSAGHRGEETVPQVNLECVV